MASSLETKKYRSIFSQSTALEREENFESYWRYTQSHDGALLEEERNLEVKKKILQDFQDKKIISRKPLDHPESFYRNYVKMQDDPKTLDQKTLLLTCLYKFARHEWAGISSAWQVTPSFQESQTLTDKMSRFHLCEEFCHVRLFYEMFKTFQLDEVKWVRMGKTTEWAYRMFSRFPEKVMSMPAFLTELMGLSFYLEIDRLLDSILEDEPEAKERIRALLHEIMIDELAHIGQRRNYIGSLGIRFAPALFAPMVKVFFHDIPESKYLLNIPRMIHEGLHFDYNNISSEMMARSWVPSYCQVAST